MDFSKVTRADVLAALQGEDECDIIAREVARLIPIFTRQTVQRQHLKVKNEVDYAAAEIVAATLRGLKPGIKGTRSIKDGKVN